MERQSTSIMSICGVILESIICISPIFKRSRIFKDLENMLLSMDITGTITISSKTFEIYKLF